MNVRLRLQMAEALDSLNRWFCCEKHRSKVTDANFLLAHYIKHGGAADFARRYSEALGNDNRWLAGEYYKREITEPAVLWHYYMRVAKRRSQA